MIWYRYSFTLASAHWLSICLDCVLAKEYLSKIIHHIHLCKIMWNESVDHLWETCNKLFDWFILGPNIFLLCRTLLYIIFFMCSSTSFAKLDALTTWIWMYLTPKISINLYTFLFKDILVWETLDGLHGKQSFCTFFKYKYFQSIFFYKKSRALWDLFKIKV